MLPRMKRSSLLSNGNFERATDPLTIDPNMPLDPAQPGHLLDQVEHATGKAVSGGQHANALGGRCFISAPKKRTSSDQNYAKTQESVGIMWFVLGSSRSALRR